VPPELSGILHDTPGSALVPIPDALSAGLGARPLPRLFVQAQFDWTNWSRLQTLTLTAPQNPMMSTSIPQNWHDGYVLRTGGEWAFDTLRVRGGFGYDWNPVPDQTLGPIVPDSNRWLVAGGASVDLPSHLEAELSVMGVIFEERQSQLQAFPAKYRDFAVLTGLALSYRPSRKAEPARSPAVAGGETTRVASSWK
jgi:long-chain fatty acid transport protein